jgi:hypothetical protein
MLLRLYDMPQTIASLLDLLSQPHHHLLQILEHVLHGRISRLLLSGMTRVMERVWLHELNGFDTKC